MNIIFKYKYYFYPLVVFIILVLVLLLLRLFQTESINLIEEEKKIPVITKSVYPKGIRPQFFFFGRVIGKNEINIISRLTGKVVFVSKKLFSSIEVKKGEVLFKIDPFELEQELIRKKALLEDLTIKISRRRL